MNKLIARLRSHKPEFRQVFTEESMPTTTFFKKPSVELATEYQPFYEATSKEEWFYVEMDADELEQMIEPYTDASNYNTPAIEQAEYDTIAALILHKGTTMLFRRITSSMRIGEHGKQLIQFGEESTELVRPSFAIDFDGNADAYFDGNKKLYFQSFSKVKPLFKGIDIFQQEATRDEKEAFLSCDMFAVGDINLDFISLRDAQKIAEIRENPKLDLDDEETQNRIRTYANNYPSSGAGINNDGKLIINNKADLAAAIKLLEQRFYTSEITDEKYEAKGANRMKR